VFHKFLLFHANPGFLTRIGGRLVRPREASALDHRFVGHPEILVKRAPHFTVVS